MNTPLVVARWLVRICGILALVLGLLFWLGDLPGRLIDVHMLLGLVLVLSLWVLAVLGARAGVNKGLVIVAAVWGLLTVGLGQAQTSLLPDFSVHWIVQVVHLALGLGAIGLGESVAARTARAGSAALEGRASQA